MGGVIAHEQLTMQTAALFPLLYLLIPPLAQLLCPTLPFALAISDALTLPSYPPAGSDHYGWIVNLVTVVFLLCDGFTQRCKQAPPQHLRC